MTINGIEDAGEVIVVHACTRGGAVKCPSCGTLTRHVHAFHERGAGGCACRWTAGAGPCPGATDALPHATLFPADVPRQAPGVLVRYQRRTVRLSEQLRGVVRELAGRAAARLLPVMGIVAGKDTAVRALLGIALPDRPVPRVLGIDDFALRRNRQYATVLIDAESGERIDVLPGRGAGVVTDWLRRRPSPARRPCRDRP